ncbi:MAG: hypothetical protein AABW50_04465 [Nanoarchaeota archaeon]
MVEIKIYSLEEKIERGKIPEAIMEDNEPGQTVRELWIKFHSNYNPNKDNRSLLRKAYYSIKDYFKEKFNLHEEIDPRDEIIKGITSRV